MPGLDGAAAAEQILARRAETIVFLLTADSAAGAAVGRLRVHDKATLTARRLQEMWLRREEEMWSRRPRRGRRLRRSSPGARPALLAKVSLSLLALPVTCLTLCTFRVEPVHDWMMRNGCPLAQWSMHPPSHPLGLAPPRARIHVSPPRPHRFGGSSPGRAGRSPVRPVIRVG